ncbi:OCIA domain-containing protein 1 [Hypomesus transpacificus]|uniref:OCIA domain-containing protein 1 n=1 Tax=Hypomesus transpacificus TaxID=137520 RepID=UPI001F0846B0|nr:OCIA domain-containing protein 1 [Hypomesus transpacificus]
MSHSSSGFTDTSQPYDGAQPEQNPALTAGYVPTEEEKRVFKECNQESFMYRSLPFSAVAVGVTQVLVAKGVLAPSPRFGSLPKIIFAGMVGYIGGKISYAKVCQEKFKNLENSPLGEALRQGRRQIPQQFAPQTQSEMGDPQQAAYVPIPASDSFSNDLSSAYQPPAFSDSAPSAPGDDIINPPAPSYLEDEGPRRDPVMYENLRSRNREHYEVNMTQKADASLQPRAGRAGPHAEVKKNKYGDTWDE